MTLNSQILPFSCNQVVECGNLIADLAPLTEKARVLMKKAIVFGVGIL